MKKRNVAIIYLLILTVGTIFSLYIPKQEAAKADTATAVIPDEAIRLRILANSDREEDQAVKRLIRDEVNQDITGWVAELTSLEDAREVIISHLDEIQATAETVIAKEGLRQSVKIEFGQAEFPTKLYGQYLYPAGDYEAVIITLGEGDGANWWCVLFPPLCFLDFSNGTAVSQSPFDEGQTAAAASQTVDKVGIEQQTEEVEVATSQPTVETKEMEPVNQPKIQVEESHEEIPAQKIEEVEENQAEDKIQVEQQLQTEEVTSQENTNSNSTNQEQQENTQTNTEQIPTEQPPVESLNEQTEQIYTGAEEPQIIEKSLIAEIFSNLF